MRRKAKSCYGCPAHAMNVCNLGYKTEVYEWFGGGALIRPALCCHKPKTVKKNFNRLMGAR